MTKPLQQPWQSLLDFWFADSSRRRWFRSTPEFDEEIRQRFYATWQHACAAELNHWQQQPAGSLALTIVLDQFPHHLFRGQAQAYADEQQAREVADAAIRAGQDQQLAPDERPFLYLPFMHSEDLDDQLRAVALYEQSGLESNLRVARHHLDIIRRFGRFPHRNAILGRPSRADECAYLASPEAFRG